ncbi:hypothetical protein AOLI_G00115290 [Acnodon oligacanthus]
MALLARNKEGLVLDRKVNSNYILCTFFRDSRADCESNGGTAVLPPHCVGFPSTLPFFNLRACGRLASRANSQASMLRCVYESSSEARDDGRRGTAAVVISPI